MMASKLGVYPVDFAGKRRVSLGVSVAGLVSIEARGELSLKSPACRCEERKRASECVCV